jgi:hypothetical protein
MLLMPPDSWWRTTLGRFELKSFVSWPWNGEWVYSLAGGAALLRQSKRGVLLGRPREI